ncbi:uncharacterized protein CBL_12895 [Carabus blaptoides fortunei]
MFGKSVQNLAWKTVRVSWLVKRHAGHSKWANIKHIKATKDAQRSLLFTRLCRQLKVAIQEGGSTNPNMNLKLAQVIEQTKRANMPMATVQSVIKGSQQKKIDCKSGMIEIKGPSGLIILCEIFTDNYNRCKMDIATVIKKYNASFSDGGGRHIFERKGVIETEIEQINDTVMDVATGHAIESGAEDVRQVSDQHLEFICAPENVISVQKSIEALKYSVTSASVEYLPKICVQLGDSDLDKMAVMFEKLANCEDVPDQTQDQQSSDVSRESFNRPPEAQFAEDDVHQLLYRAGLGAEIFVTGSSLAYKPLGHSVIGYLERVYFTPASMFGEDGVQGNLLQVSIIAFHTT